MRNSPKILKRTIVAANQTLQSLLDLDAQVAKAADLIEESLRAGNKLLVCGNGGSAADASHFATEFVVRFTKDRPAYPAICLSGDGGLLTAAGNDYGFDEVFARQVAAFGLEGDVLICLTTSGKSRNVERALERPQAENDCLPRSRRRFNHWHGRCRSFGSQRIHCQNSGSAPASPPRAMRDDRIRFNRKQCVEAGVSPALQQKEVADTADPQRYSDFFSSRSRSD
jgi:phosphoheptose isomerase